MLRARLGAGILLTDGPLAGERVLELGLSIGNWF